MQDRPLFGGIGARKTLADPTTARFKRVVLLCVALGVAAFAWSQAHPPEALTVVRVELGLRPEAPLREPTSDALPAR
jgi:hypothetical protein